jgi:hypothetical protein
MSHGVKSISGFKHAIDNGDGVSFTVEYESGDKTDYHFWGLSYGDAKDFTNRNNNPRDTTLEVTQAAEIARLERIIESHKKSLEGIIFGREL